MATRRWHREWLEMSSIIHLVSLAKTIGSSVVTVGVESVEVGVLQGRLRTDALAWLQVQELR